LNLVGVNNGWSDNPRIAVPLGGLTKSIAGTGGLPVFYQILVQGTESGTVNISNLSIDGSYNKVNNGGLVGIIYHNASGQISDVAVSQEFAHGTGFGMVLEATTPTPKTITVVNCSIHGFEQFGLTAGGNVVPQSLTANIRSNAIISTNSLTGEPAGGGIYSNALGEIVGNHIFTQQPPQGVGIEVQSNLTVSSNTIDGFILGIWDLGDSNTIEHNTMSLVGGGIGVSGNNNLVQYNSMINLPNGASAIGFNCTGTSNTVIHNNINEASVGILNDPRGNVLTPNLYANVMRITLSSCQ
jgi:hypothetical protein